jgi:hypothetical protein
LSRSRIVGVDEVEGILQIGPRGAGKADLHPFFRPT